MSSSTIAQAVWVYPSRTLAASGEDTPDTRVEEIASAVWSYATRTLTSPPPIVTEETFTLPAAYSVGKSVGTCEATNGTEPYTWRIVYQKGPAPDEFSYSPESQVASVGIPIDPFVPTLGVGFADAYDLAPTSDPLPDGLSLDPDTGEVTGTPTTETYAVIITVRVTDAFDRYADASFSIAVQATPGPMEFFV